MSRLRFIADCELSYAAALPGGLVLLLLTVILVPGCKPGRPVSLRAQADSNAIALKWKSPPPLSFSPVRFNVYRSVDSIRSTGGQDPLNKKPLRGPSYIVSHTDRSAKPWQPYRYRVTAVRVSEGEIAESNLSYPITYTLPKQTYTLEAPDPQGPPRFGYPINRVGDHGEDGAEDLLVGTVAFEQSKRLYRIDGATGTVEARLRPEGLSPEDIFGFFGSSAGDLNDDGAEDILVASPGASSASREQAGRAHLLDGSDGSVIWSQRSPRPQEEGRFGAGAVVGDLNADGVPDIAAAAPGESAGGLEKAGRAYLLDGTAGTVLDTLASPDPQEEAGFGFLNFCSGDVLPSVDFNGDGTDDLIAPVSERDVDGTENAGRVYLFDGAAFQERQQLDTIRTLESPNPEDEGQFGEHVAVLSDINEDGTPDLAVSATYEPAVNTDEAGRVYLISGADGSIIRTLTSPLPEEEGYFGHSTESADVNRDGTADLAVRSSETVGGHEEAGRIYLFDGEKLLSGSSPREALLRRYVSLRPEDTGLFGADFEILETEDLLVAGASGETSAGAEDSGRIWAFPLP